MNPFSSCFGNDLVVLRTMLVHTHAQIKITLTIGGRNLLSSLSSWWSFNFIPMIKILFYTQTIFRIYSFKSRMQVTIFYPWEFFFFSHRFPSPRENTFFVFFFCNQAQPRGLTPKRKPAHLRKDNSYKQKEGSYEWKEMAYTEFKPWPTS